MPKKKSILETYKLPHGRALMLRTVAADRTAYGGFVWPASGKVKAPDWDPAPRCGGGLHGFRWGVGNVSLASAAESAIWLVVEFRAGSETDLGGKIKIETGSVVFSGARVDAVALIQRWAPPNVGPCMYGTATAGDSGTATAGYAGTATAGYAGTATAGYAGTATAGDSGTATAGDSGTATAGGRGTATAGGRGTATAGGRGTATAGGRGTATAGDSGTATAGYAGTATAGGRGTATAGDSGTATAGDSGTATAGYAGTATAGYAGTATAGYAGTATAGLYGYLSIAFWDSKLSIYRKAIAKVDGEQIKAGVRYRLNAAHDFEAVT